MVDYLGTPSGSGPWPGVVVVHEIFGLNDSIRAIADRMAEHGYLALAVDLFNGRPVARCLLSAVRQLRSGSGPMYAILEAGRRGLAEREDCTGQVGVLGFCLGGGFALMVAPRGFEAAAVSYAPQSKDLDSALAGSCPIVASYGGADRSLKGAAAKLEQSLTRLGVPHDVKEYPGATHAFMSDKKPPWIIERLTGLKIDPAATSDTWRRVDAFFGRYLSGPKAAD